MKQKINLQDLSALLAEKSKINQKEAETFLKELFDIIQKALLSGEESVRIKNLGTFKRLAVSDRESIDVTNGKRMVIPAHYKVNFIPDHGLASAVNEPFVLFDIVELDETTKLNDSEQTEELKAPEEIEVPEKIEIPKPPQEIKTPQAPKKIEEPKEIEVPPVPNKNKENERPQVKIEEPPVLNAEPNLNDREEPPKGTRHRHHRHSSRSRKRRKKRLLTAVIYLLVIAFLTSILGYLYLLDTADVSEEVVLNSALITDTIPNIAVNNGIVADNDTTSESVPEIEADKQYIMHSGDLLTTVALAEYGNKIFWVYLYEENKDIIKNPNVVPKGTVITIPPASKYGINKDNQESILKAVQLQQSYTKK
ncbi:hypothetical protein FACS1894182_10550 [Bacteroidia bacterium]|nr:hypothetical protein FACS1894182_10550 [Bacteroidia bacterium]